MARLPLLPAERLEDATAEGVVLLDFWQETCPPCRVLEPRLEAFARRHRHELRAYRVDVDQDQRTPERFGVMAIPTLVLLRDGEEVRRLDGLVGDDELEGALAEARS